MAEGEESGDEAELRSSFSVPPVSALGLALRERPRITVAKGDLAAMNRRRRRARASLRERALSAHSSSSFPA